jgi:hypothetical protein
VRMDHDLSTACPNSVSSTDQRLKERKDI